MVRVVCQFPSNMCTNWSYVNIRLRIASYKDWEHSLLLDIKHGHCHDVCICVCGWTLQKAVPLKELLPCLLFISQQMFPVLHKWRYYDARARDRIGEWICYNYFLLCLFVCLLSEWTKFSFYLLLVISLYLVTSWAVGSESWQKRVQCLLPRQWVCEASAWVPTVAVFALSYVDAVDWHLACNNGLQLIQSK